MEDTGYFIDYESSNNNCQSVNQQYILHMCHHNQ